MAATAAFAQSAYDPDNIVIKGQPTPGAYGFQPAATDVFEMTHWFHDDILMPFIVIPISVFVALLMLWVMFRYRAKANPEPRRFSHNTFIEVVWTLAPAIIVFVIAIIGVRQVYFQDAATPEEIAEYSGIAPEPGEVVLKAIGNRWFWEYEYPEEGIGFASNLDIDKEPRLLMTDNHVVLPVNTIVRIQVTANPADVIHAWTIPAFGVKLDAVPGRLNERWFRVLPGHEGRYFGQCSELCGTNHAFMPITVDVVSPEQYQAWLSAKKVELGIEEAPAELAPEGEPDAAPAEEGPEEDDNEQADAATQETVNVSLNQESAE